DQILGARACIERLVDRAHFGAAQTDPLELLARCGASARSRGHIQWIVGERDLALTTLIRARDRDEAIEQLPAECQLDDRARVNRRRQLDAVEDCNALRVRRLWMRH